MVKISQRLRAWIVDALIASAPFFILVPLAYYWSNSPAAGALIAQAAVFFAGLFSALLFAILIFFQAIKRQPTPGQRWAGVSYQPDGPARALRRMLPGAGLLLLAALTSYWSLLLLYPAVLLLTGRSPAEWVSQCQLQASANAAPPAARNSQP